MKLNTFLLGCVVAFSPITVKAQQKQIAVNPELAHMFRYLDSDGQHLSISDDKEYLEDIATLADKLLGPDLRKEKLRNLSFLKLISVLGFDQITATGSSSKQHGNFHTKKFFIGTRNNMRGVFSLLGEKPRPFVASGFAPEGTDLIIETQLNLSQVADTTFKVVEIISPDDLREVKQNFATKVPVLDETVEKVLSHIDARLSIVAELDLNSRKRPFKATARIDHVAKYLWPVVEMEAKKNTKVESNGNVHRFSIPIEGESLTVVFDLDADQVWLSMDKSHLVACMSKGKKLAVSGIYQLATRELPNAGSSELYISKNAISTLIMLAESQIPQEKIEENVRETWDSIKKKLSNSNGIAFRIQKNSDGLLLAGNTPYRIRNMNLLYATPVLASIATPVVMQKLKMADKTKCIQNLKMLGASISVFNNDKGRYPKNLNELVAGSYLSAEQLQKMMLVKSDAGRVKAVYLNGNATPENAILIYTPKPIVGRYVYLLKDGSVQVSREGAFRRRLRATKMKK